MILGYTVPGVVGTNITLSCPPEMILNGPDSSTCTEEGMWEPKPSEAECKGEYYIIFRNIVMTYTLPKMYMHWMVLLNLQIYPILILNR